ncbi:hypothetical protein D3Z36_15320 [Lachnospiraceae bacterium]|nr:hypothetical protein [Lachnospiraceae bacterium]
MWRYWKVTGDMEAKICIIACSDASGGYLCWKMQKIADELVRLEVVDYISGSAVCEVMKKVNLSRGL